MPRGRRRRERVDPTDWFDPVEIENARSYNRSRQRHALGSLVVFVSCLVAATAVRAPERLIEATGTGAWITQVLVVSVSLSLAFTVLTTPIDLVGHQHETRWGVLPRKAFWIDAGEDLLFGFFLVPVAVLALWGLVRLTSWWWLALSVPVSAAPLLAAIVLARSRKLVRVADHHLEGRIRRIAREAGATVLDVYATPARTDPRAPDSYVAGLGRSTRLVLSQDVLDRPIKEIEVLLARRLSALKNKLRWKSLLLRAFAAPLALLPSHLAISSDRVQQWLGITERYDPRAIPLFLLVLVPSFFLLTTLTSWQARSFTRTIDADVLDFTRDPDAFESVVRTFHAKLMAHLAPSFYQRIRSDLPPAAERLAMADRWRRSRRVAVLFTDVEASTALIERLGDDAWYELLQDHNEILRKQVAAHKGAEIDSAGDGFLFVFEDVGAAVLCAIDIQHALARYSAGRQDPLLVRIGVHTGEVIRSGTSMVGREVHLAARVASSAPGGQILVSGEVYDALSSTGRFRFGEERELEFKGLSGSHRVYEVEWTGATTSGAPPEPVAS